jgi:recombination protein RecA
MVKVVKNKMAPPFKKAEFDIMYNEGISRTGEIIDMAVQYKIIEKSGSWFLYGKERIGQGRENAREYLRARPETMDEIAQKIRELESEPQKKT